MPPVAGGIEVIVLPSGEPDPLEPLRAPAELEVRTPDVAVTIRPIPAPANDPPPG